MSYVNKSYTKQERSFLEHNKKDTFWKLEQNKNNAFWNIKRMILFGNWNKTRINNNLPIGRHKA